MKHLRSLHRPKAALAAALVLGAVLAPLLAAPAFGAVGVRANAGASQVVSVGDIVTLDGSRSYTLSGGNLTYKWDFNESDGIQVDATGVIASHQYNESGIFTVTLTVSDGAQSDTDTTSIIVTSTGGTVPGVPNLPPVAVPPLTQTGFQNRSMVFDGTRSFDPNGDNLTYYWDFSDLDGLTPGGDKQGAVVAWTYTVAGVYNITLIVSDGNASDAGRTNAIVLADNGTVIPGVNLPPVAVAEGDQLGTVNQPMQFNANRSFDLDGDALTYLWDFDSRDGTTQVQARGQVVSWTYSETGLYNVTLTVTDSRGQDTDTLHVIVRNEFGVVPGVGNLPPIAIIRSPIPGQRYNPAESILFDGCDSFDPEGGPLFYQWNFPDGGVATRCNTNHAFAEGGIKLVQFFIQDDADLLGANTVTIFINDSGGPVNRQPQGDIEGPSSARVGQVVNFSANFTDEDGDPLNYSWDFNLINGLQTEATGRNISWVFNETCQQCTVTVAVSDGQHRNFPVLAFNNIQVLPKETHPPEAFAGNDTSAMVGQGIVFNCTGTDPDGNITRYEWDFEGDGAYDWQDPNSGFVIYSYPREGNYTAVCRVTDNDRLTATDSRGVVVTPRPNNPPTAEAGPDKPTETQGVEVFFHGTGSDSDGAVVLYEWDFDGNGLYDWSNGTGGDAFHTYANAGRYTAVLRVTDERGASATDIANVTVKRNEPPVADTGPDQLAQAGAQVTFTGARSSDPEGPITRYSWDFDSSDGLQEDSTAVTPQYTYTRGGTYLVTLTVWDAFGQSDTDTAFVEVAQTGGVSTAIDVAGKELGPDESSSYLLTITNTGDGTDSFTLAIQGDEDIASWYTLETRQINNLEAGAVRIVRLSVQVPKNALVEQSTAIEVVTRSQWDPTKAAFVAVLTTVKEVVKIQIEFSVFPPDAFAGETHDITVRVTNLGNSGAKIIFKQGSAEGGWIAPVSSAQLQLNPGKFQDVPFTLVVPAGTPSGKVTLSLTAQVSGTNVTHTQTVDLEVIGKTTFLPALTIAALGAGLVVAAVAVFFSARPKRRA